MMKLTVLMAIALVCVVSGIRTDEEFGRAEGLQKRCNKCDKYFKQMECNYFSGIGVNRDSTLAVVVAKINSLICVIHKILWYIYELIMSLFSRTNPNRETQVCEARCNQVENSAAAMYVSWVSKNKSGIALYDQDIGDSYILRSNVDIDDQYVNSIIVNRAADRIYLMVSVDDSNDLLTYAWEPCTGRFKMAGNISTGAGSILEMTLDPDEMYLLASDNVKGDLIIHPIDPENGIADGDGVKVVKPPGPGLPENAFPSVITFHPEHPNLFVVAYTGPAVMRFFDFDKNDGSATPLPIFRELPDWTGPIYVVFSNSGRFMHVTGYMQELFTFELAFDGSGRLTNVTQVQEISTLPEEGQDVELTQVVVSSDDQHLYVNNYNVSLITIYKFDMSTGNLTLLGFEKIDCSETFDTAILPVRNQLVVTCADDDKIILYDIPEDGILTSPITIAKTKGPDQIFIPKINPKLDDIFN